MSYVDEMFYECVIERVVALEDRIELERITDNDKAKINWYEDQIKVLLEIILEGVEE